MEVLSDYLWYLAFFLSGITFQKAISRRKRRNEYPEHWECPLVGCIFTVDATNEEFLEKAKQSHFDFHSGKETKLI